MCWARGEWTDNQPMRRSRGSGRCQSGPAPQDHPPSTLAFFGSSPVGPSIQELVNRGTILGARDQIPIVRRCVTTQDVCGLLYLEGKRGHGGTTCGVFQVLYRALFKAPCRPEAWSRGQARFGAQGGAQEFPGPQVLIPLDVLNSPGCHLRGTFQNYLWGPLWGLGFVSSQCLGLHTPPPST